MSRIVSNSNVLSIESVKSNSDFSSLTAICAAAILGSTASAVYDLFKGDVNLTSSKIKTSNASVLKSTHACREEFTTLFAQKFNNMQTISSKLNSTNYKTAFINSLSGSGYRIKNQQVIKESIAEVLNLTNLKDFKKKADRLVIKIEQQHTGVIKDELILKIKEASYENGFSDIRIIQREANCTIISAENNNGQALVHELHVNAKINQIDHKYEVVGVKNDYCETIVNKFQESLETKGIYFSKIDKKPTGGIVVLPFSKEAQKQVEQKKKNQALKRARKLNQNKNISIT
jgi:hypothetical protein